MADSMRPHRQAPRPWDSPGKNTGVGCHFLLQYVKVKSQREVAQSCPTLRDPMDCSPPGSSIHGIFQARVLEWVAIAFSNGLFTNVLFGFQKLVCLYLSVVDFQLNSIVSREHVVWFHPFKFIETCFMAQNMFSLSKCSVCSWEEGIFWSWDGCSQIVS